MPTGPDGTHSWAQSIRRQAGSPSVQFSQVNLRNFTPVLPLVRYLQIGYCRLDGREPQECSRKVRAPEGALPGNAWAIPQGVDGKCNRKQTANDAVKAHRQG